jgi:hypothetical protein
VTASARARTRSPEYSARSAWPIEFPVVLFLIATVLLPNRWFLGRRERRVTLDPALECVAFEDVRAARGFAHNSLLCEPAQRILNRNASQRFKTQGLRALLACRMAERLGRRFFRK